MNERHKGYNWMSLLLDRGLNKKVILKLTLMIYDVDQKINCSHGLTRLIEIRNVSLAF